ncbi:winged helix-turn-helix domain-containing protein [Akkermansiaceae bacterium]|nr:winged helix-turn-helix domain-containing protein [Akkermansiaceae bacterium]
MLTPREFLMLVLLNEKMNRPLSRDEFLNRCWGMDYFPDAHSLDQHIHMLRKKIGGEAAVIETVRGVGYRFRSGES